MTLFLWACPRGEVESELKLSPFFDLQDFVDKEVTRLKASGIQAEKTIELNGKAETQNLESVDFAQELVLLRNADINRPAWLDQYQVDSLVESGKLRQLSYRALSDEMRTQRLVISYDAQEAVQEINVENQSKTFLSEGTLAITYNTEKGMMTNSQQKNRSTEPTEVLINLRFIPTSQ